jgi:gliding motility-associated-like protein
MKNRFTRFGQPVLSIFVFLFLLNSLSAQNCDNSNPFFNFSYTGPTEIEVNPGTCLGTLTWPNNTPSISCRLNQPDTCGVNIFTMDVGLTGYSQGNQIPAGNTVTVYYRLVGNVLVNGTFMNVQDTFCFEIDFVDKNPPVFNNLPPSTLLVVCPSAVPPMMPLEADDDCDNTYPKNVNGVETVNGNPCSGAVITRVWSTTDVSGNISSFMQQITVAGDTTKPVVTKGPVGDTISCDMGDYGGWLNAQLDTLAKYATDNCGSVNITHDGPVSVTQVCGNQEVTFTVADPCGNDTTFTVNFMAIDTVPPVISGVGAADTLFFNCTDPVPAQPSVTASDNCTSNINIIPFIVSTQTQNPNGSCSDYDYTITRTYTATDSCGNSTTHIQTLIFRDNQAPDFDVPANVDLNCGESIDPSNTGLPTNITDNCDASPHFTFDDVQIDTMNCQFNLMITREWTVTDTCGNSTIKTQIITLRDTVSPTFTVPRDTVVDCQFANDPSATGDVTDLSDNCDPNPSIRYEDVIIAGSCTNSYDIQRLWIAEDTCGNADTLIQLVTVLDTIPPQITAFPQNVVLQCEGGTSATDSFNLWVAAYGNAMAVDNCSNSLNWVAYNAGTTDAPDLPAKICNLPNTNVIRERAVDFIVSDLCGFADTLRATFSVIDTIAPEILDCPDNIDIPNDPGLCGATINMLPPVFSDVCEQGLQSYTFFQQEPITSNGPFGDLDIPVNDVNIGINVGFSSLTLASNVNVSFVLENIDGESPTEYFLVYDENGNYITQTNFTNGQCGTSTTNITFTNQATIYQWLTDGVINFTLVPNVPASLPGRFAINNICNNASVRANIQFEAYVANNITYEYSIDKGPRINVPTITAFNEFFGVGEYDITYFLTDCAGNTDSCEWNIRIQDLEAPVFDCPSNIDVFTGLDSCSAAVTLPLPFNVSDNCGIEDSYSMDAPQDPDSSFITFYPDPNHIDTLANDKQLTFGNITGNAFGSGAVLTVYIQGNVDQYNEYFTVIGEDGTILGNTEVGQPHVMPGNCDTASVATFTIPDSLLNVWAQDGQISFNFEAFNNDTLGVLIPGITPCGDVSGPLFSLRDTTSRLWANLSFFQITPSYFITGRTQVPLTTVSPGQLPKHVFNQGNSRVNYVIEDINGNRDTCSFRVRVIDNEPPVATCQPSIVRINPGGSVTDTISPSDVGALSTDNCGIDTLFVFPSIFNCSQIDDTINVMLVAVDLSGNTDTCHTFIRVEGEEPVPSYDYVCGSDSLYLFANPPAAPGNVVYTYRWYGPLGNLFSTTQNPIISNLDDFEGGNYCVEIEGLTGCTTIGCINIPLDIRPPQPTLNGPAQVCWDGNDINLSTPPPMGITGTASYQWYSGTFPGGTLLATTAQASYTIPAPHSVPANSQQDFCYYVIVSVDGCESQPSNELCVNVVRPPDIAVTNSMVAVCEGTPLVLSTPLQGPGLTYNWSGPVNVDDIRQPLVTDSTNAVLHSGNYYLQVALNGCLSEEATVIVNVLEIPDQAPNIFPTNTTVCEGQDVTLQTNLAGVTAYSWTPPIGADIMTTTNSLTFTANMNSNGQWRVRGVVNYTNPSAACYTPYSPVANVNVDQFPAQVAASAQPNPVCEGQSIQLQATPNLVNASYQWYDPSGALIAVTQNPTINNLQQANAGTYRVVVTNPNGCSKEATVNVSVAPPVQVVAVSNNGPNCYSGPTSVELSLIVFPPDPGNYTYEWTGPCSFTSGDSLATVDLVDFACKGIYRVQVTNAAGCKSNIATTNVDGLGPFTTPTVTKNPDKPTYCEGEAITLSTTGYPGTSTTYVWTLPNNMGTINTANPSLVIDPLDADIHNGPYKVKAIVEGCETNESGQLNVNVQPKPVAIPEAEIPCEGGTLRLTGGFTPAGGTLVFDWQAPNGSIYRTQNPNIPNVTANEFSGDYIFTVTRNGCSSDPEIVNVNIDPAPTTPVPIPVDPICLGSTNRFQLCINPNSSVAGARYVWTNEFGDTVGITTNLCLNVNDLTGFTAGNYSFFVTTFANGCTSTNPNPVVVSFNEVPTNNADAGEDFEVCEGDPIILNAMPPDVGGGCWTYIGNLTGVTLTNPCQPTTSVNGLPPGGTYTFRWSLSSGGCDNYSTDDVRITIYEVENADAGPSRIDTCDVTRLNLRAVPSLSGLGFWRQDSVQVQLGVRIINPNNPNTRVDLPGPGTYRFCWVIPDVVCGGDEDCVIVNVSQPNPFPGDDFEDCGTGCTVLNADPNQNGVWTSNNNNIVFEDPSDPETSVCGLVEGMNTLFWTIDNGICGPDSRATLLVDYQLSPFAVDDVYNINYGGTRNFNVVANDQNVSAYTINILTPPNNGELTLIGNRQMEYTANLNFIGTDLAVYQICPTDPDCPCSEGAITFNIGANIEDCEVPTIITPNGDTKNEVFSIPCLVDNGKYPNNELIIFNQWGDEVFRQSPYRNNWDGTFSGQQLPDGTYFYVLDLGTGDKPLTGYVVIQR